jgi:transcriptional regulator with XRE-family HTH domain
VVNETTKRLMARVKQLRQAQGLTQEQFAERADLDPKYYQHVEAGRKPNPGIDTLLKLAKGAGLELWQLLKFDESVAPASEAMRSTVKNSSRTPKRRPAPKQT